MAATTYTAPVWDASGSRFYETGVKKCVLYVQNDSGAYPEGVAWNGITGITESPSGADANDMYADDMKYLSIRSAEDFGATIEAYTYPDEWAQCDGSAEIATGVMAGQQKRCAFGLCYRTALGNDIENNDYGYKLHLIYNATASPSERSYSTINDSPEAITFSWELTTLPVEVGGSLKPTSIITIDSKKVDSTKLAELEKMLYGVSGTIGSSNSSDDTGVKAHLPSPSEVYALFNPGR